jgi:hypothetical protein
MRKVNLQVIRPWVAKTVVDLVGLEDEVVIEYAMGLLEDESQPVNLFPMIFSVRTCFDTTNRHRIPKKCRSTLPDFSRIPLLLLWLPSGTY